MAQNEHEEVYKKLNHLKAIITIDLSAGRISGENLSNKSFWLKLWTVITSAILTIILGLKIADWWNGWGSNIALILSAILTALNTWDAFAKYEPRASQELTLTNKLSLLFKRISLYQVGNIALTLEQYYNFEKEYLILQEEYLDQRKESENQSVDQQPSGESTSA